MVRRRTDRKRRIQSRRRSTAKPPARKSGKRVLVVIVIVCFGTAGLWGIFHFLNSSKTTEMKEAVRPSLEQPAHSTVLPELPVEEQIAALKKEETELAQTVAKDFPGNTEALFLLGSVYRNHGVSEKAAECWERCLEINPEDAKAYNNLGRIAFQKGNYEKALELWQKASEINPNLERIYNSLGGALTCLGRTEEAISMFQKDIDISERPIQSHYMLGVQYQLLKEYEKAKQCYETVIEIQPNHVSAYHGLATVCAMLGDKEKSGRLMEKFRNLKAEEMKALKERDRRFNDLVLTRRSAAKTCKDIGQFYYIHSYVGKAEELLQRAASLDPEQSGCRVLLASLYEQDGRISQALQCYEELSRIEPDNVHCHGNIGVICFELQRYEEAEKAFRKVIELDPNQSSGYRYLAFLYLCTNKRLDEARALAEKAVALEKTGDNFFVLSIACDETGDRAGAIRAIEQAMELEPENEKYRQIYEQLKKEN
jgi:tetratricopeptide (TPR) repeat protein